LVRKEKKIKKISFFFKKIVAIIVKRIIWTDCVGEKNNYMGSVFFILTVDTILEKVLGQYTHEHSGLPETFGKRKFPYV
jgi:hypothetical protein